MRQIEAHSDSEKELKIARKMSRSSVETVEAEAQKSPVDQQHAPATKPVEKPRDERETMGQQESNAEEDYGRR